MKRQARILHHIVMSIVMGVFGVTWTSYASAQDLPKGTIEATGLFGIVSGIGTHGVVGASVGAAVWNHFLINGEFSYIPLGSESVDILGVQSDFSARGMAFNVGGQYQLKRSGKLRPYLGAGVGLLHTSSSSSVTTSFAGFNFSGGSSGNDAYFNFGGGGRYYVSDRWGFKPELMIFAGSKTFGRISGGVFYQFGK